MDNLRKHNNGRRRPAAMDGFVKGPRSQGTDKGVFRVPSKNSSANGQGPIGNFKRSDGFYMASSGTVHSNGRSAAGESLAQVRRPTRDAGGNIQLGAAPEPKRLRKKRFGKKLKPPLTRGRKILKGVLLFGLVIVLTGGFLFGKAYLKSRQILKGGGGAAALQKDVDPSQLNGEGDGRVNVLLIGKDAANGLTDTILVASINPVQKEAVLLSIPRDLYVDSESTGRGRINGVFPLTRDAKVLEGASEEEANEAGIKALEQTVEETIGINIHYYVTINFDGFEQAVDTVGGVGFEVKESVYEVLTLPQGRYTLDVKEGYQQFDGIRALAYSRCRHCSARSDFDRSERQKQVIIALKEKILSLGTLSNPVKINNLLDDFGDNLETNFSISELLRVYEIGQQIPSSSIRSLSFVDEPNVLIVGQDIGGASVQVPKAGNLNFKEIQNFVRSNLKDGYIVDENANIMILNGTVTSGLASRTSDELKSFGYNVSQIGDASTKGYENTIIVDLRDGKNKFTKRYLEQRFKTTTVGQLPDATIQTGNADFVIILGQSEVARLGQ